MKANYDNAPDNAPIKASAVKASAMGRGVGGRQKLIEAALHLASSTHSLASLGLREVTRYAGLAPNAFYRHFRNFDELGLAAVELLGGELRRGLRERRLRRKEGRNGPSRISGGPNEVIHLGRDIVNQSVALVLEFVTEHRVAYIVGIRELHGSSPVMRAALQRLMEEFAADMAEDMQSVLRLPGLDAPILLEISRQVIRQMTFFSMDYLEHPEQREAIRDQAERFIMRLFAGELAIQASGQLAGAGGKRQRG
jgi:AcrR family transcriptional regulator